jgi:hypothetical protein
MRTTWGWLIVLGLAWGAAGLAAADDRWIHVRVDDRGDGGDHVDIQVPIGMVATLLPSLAAQHAHGSIHVDGSRMDLDEIKSYWSAVRDAKDGEYVTVRDADADVRIAKSGGMLRINVDEKGSHGRVRMTIPLPLVDALLAGGGELDLGALSGALAKAPSGDLITVDDEDSHVRIWIDGQAAPAREEAP